MGAAEVGRAEPAGRGQWEEGDTRFLRPVTCVLGKEQCQSRLTPQQAFFRAGKKRGILISKFWGKRRRYHAHIFKNRKEVVEAFTGT